MNIWDWVADFRAQAAARNDRQRLRLADLNHEAYQYRYTNPDQMIAMLDEGKRLARALREPWWEVFFDYWWVEAVLTYKGDYRNLLDRAVALVLEARKPVYEKHPLQFSFHLVLVRSYLAIDARGHAEQVQESLDYLASRTPEEGSGKYLLLFGQQAFAFELERWEEARALSFRTLALTDVEPNRYTARHYRVWAHAELCPVLFAQQDWEALREFAVTGEELARAHSDQYEVARLLAWQAVAARHDGREDLARRHLRLATATMSRLGMAPASTYYTALCACHEMAGNLDASWQVREEQLRGLVGKGQPGAECQCRLERCRLLARMGLPLAEEIAAARSAAASLRQPGWLLQELEKLEKA